MPSHEQWITDGARITDPNVLAMLRTHIEEVGPLIIEHRHFKGSAAPDRMIISEFEDLLSLLQDRASPGDSFFVWSFDEACRDENPICHGKVPDSEGRTPAGGAY